MKLRYQFSVVAIMVLMCLLLIFFIFKPDKFEEKIEEMPYSPSTLIIQNKIANNAYYKCVLIKNKHWSKYITIIVDSNDNFITDVK